jgi:two-component system, OmpR family, response regulator
MKKNLNKRILVVDDEPQDTHLLKAFLERNQYVVKEENDSRAALSAAEEFNPDLILLDVLMPEMDGGELAARFEANPKFKGIPIVFLTSKITKEEADHCRGRIGKYRFLAKPIVLPEVLACVEEHLRVAG